MCLFCVLCLSGGQAPQVGNGCIKVPGEEIMSEFIPSGRKTLCEGKIGAFCEKQPVDHTESSSLGAELWCKPLS